MSGNILGTFVDNNVRYTRKNMGDIVITKTRKLELWQHDYAFVQMFISNTKSAHIDVRVRHIGSVTVELFSLESTLAFIGHAGWYARNPEGIMPTGPKVPVDDVLQPFEAYDSGEEGYKCIFAKVTSSDVVGKSDVSFDVYENDIMIGSLTMTVKVLPIAMPKPQDYTFKVEYWHHPFNVAEYYGVEPWSDEHMAILRDHQAFYKALGGEAVTCTILDEVWGGQTYSKHDIRYPSMVKWSYSHGKWTFDYTDFDKWVDLNILLGLGTKFVCYSMMPWNSRMRYYNADKHKYVNRRVTTTFKGRYQRAWRVFLEDFARHLDAKGIFDNIYIGFDERNNMGMILDFLDSFTNKDGHHFKVSASFNNYMGNRACLDRIDSASVGLDEIKEHESEYKSIAEERSVRGKYTTMYTATEHFPNSFALSIPAESYWSIMYARAVGNNGFLRWAFDAWVEDPLVDATHWSFQAGDCFLIYPNRETLKPQWSYRLIELDEAVRDVNRLAILSQKTELAGRITEIFAKSRKNYSYRTAYDSAWAKACRPAKWADNESEKAIVEDVKTIKEAILSLTGQYLELIEEDNTSKV